MIRTITWTLLFALLLDVTINIILSLPYVQNGNSTLKQLTVYFEYGRSVEGKLLKMIGDSNATARNIAKAGWFKPEEINPEPSEKSPAATNVYIYGMSFSAHIGEILSEMDDSLNVKMYGGPGAPLNHSYAYYSLTRHQHEEGDIVIIGLLASALPRLNTMTHMTKNWEAPAPHFYPRYRINDDREIIEDSIDIQSLDELRAIIENEAAWEKVKEELEKNDSFYDPIVFEEDILDLSVYGRLLKRAWAQKSINSKTSQYHNSEGFSNQDGTLDVARKLVSDFVDSVRADKANPYLILFNDRLYHDHLYAALEPVLTSKKIPHYSTHHRFPATDLSNFIPDGHFTPEIDRSVAASVYQDLMTVIDVSDNTRN
jgi:hypothetical protein